MAKLIKLENLQYFGQNLWTKIKDTFMTKEDAIDGVLVGQEWTMLESVVGDTPIALPSTDSFTELYIEMYSSNGTITHQKNIKIDSILFESNNTEYREILLDSIYDAQTYVKYDFATNSIIPVMYEGNEIADSSTEVTTRVYTKTNKIEAGNIKAEKIAFDNSASGMNANNVQGALDELKNTIGYNKGTNILKLPATVGSSLSIDGITSTKIGNNTYKIDGTLTVDYQWIEIGYNYQISTAAQTNPYLLLDNNKTYTLSVEQNVLPSGNLSGFLINVVGVNAEYPLYLTTEKLSQTINNESGLTRTYIKIPKGVTFENYIIKVQLEEGSEVTDFNDYVPDVDGSFSNVYGAIDMVKSAVGFSKKNLLSYPYHSLTVASNGVTWSDDGEGRLTANGTPSTNDSYVQCARYNITLPADTYVLNGCPKGASSSTYYSVLYYTENNTRHNVAFDYGDGATFTLDKPQVISLDIVIVKSYTANNIVFKPMIRYASIEDDTYESYVADIQSQLLSIKQKAVKVTTDANGNANTTISADAHVINIKSLDYQATEMLGFIPCVANSYWYVRITKNNSSYAPFASKEINLTITYLE